MSFLLGSPGDRWHLADAVDALADAARRAGVPGLIWIAGAFYPSLNLNVDLVRSFLAFFEGASGIPLPGEGDVGPLVTLFAPHTVEIRGYGFFQTIGYFLLFVPLLLVVYRFIAGLALVSDPQIWDTTGKESSFVFHVGVAELSDIRGRRTVRLRTVWRAGKGLGAVMLGLWIMLLGLLVAAMVVLIDPLVVLVQMLDLSTFSPLFAGLMIPILLLLLAYAIVLMVINQLALHSLVHNRRGVASALTHAWRLVRASPMSVLRATLVDFVLFVSILVLAEAVGRALGAIGPLAWMAPLIGFLLYGFAGVTRAGFWARTYRALGGLSSADHVPGL